MNKRTLFVGAATMFVFALIFHIESHLSVGLGLMWIGLSLLQSEKDKR